MAVPVFEAESFLLVDSSKLLFVVVPVTDTVSTSISDLLPSAVAALAQVEEDPLADADHHIRPYPPPEQTSIHPVEKVAVDLGPYLHLPHPLVVLALDQEAIDQFPLESAAAPHHDLVQCLHRKPQ